MSRRSLWLAGAALVLGAIVTPAQAVAQADDRWLPFEGCWRPSEATNANVCIVGDGQGARVIELSNGVITRESRLIADGRARPVSQEGCTGTESVRWSAGGTRLYSSTQMTCGSRIPRNTTGMFAVLSGREWVSIQAVAVDNEAATRVVRYQEDLALANVPESILAPLRQNRLARETARMAAATPLTLGDVKEAAGEVHGRAVEALLFERKQTFELSGKKLVKLADEGVPTYLIDALVAVSHPNVFAVRDTRATPVGEERDTRAYSIGSAYCDDLWYNRYDRFCDTYYNGYSRFSAFGYGSPYGYGRYGYYSPPRIIYINDGNVDTPAHGSVTRRGYSNNSSGSSSTGRSSSVSSGSSSSGTARSSGSSGSSSSGGGDRGTAKPRGGTK